MNPAPSSSFEAVVVGTGIVGLASALALARKGLRVGLLGPRDPLPPAAPDDYDPRVYALSPASQQLLAGLGVWEALPAERVAAVTNMEIRGDGAPGRPHGKLELSAWQGGADNLAWIVEAREMERVLRQAVQWSGVKWTVDRFAALGPDDGSAGVQLHTAGGQTLAARLAVAADGADSPLREAAGLPAERSDYGAVGVVVHLDAALPHQGCACQWFTPDGVLALLPMPDTAAGPQVSMVWSIPKARARALLDMPAQEQAAELEARLAQATRGRLGALTPRGRAEGFPLILQRCRQLAHAGVALVGDAAHVVHPLAGQGLNLGLGDAGVLAETLAARETFRDVADPRVLRRYQRARAEPLLAMRAVTDGLYHLFNIQAAPVALLRNVGLEAVNRLPLVKRLLVRGASGS